MINCNIEITRYVVAFFYFDKTYNSMRWAFMAKRITQKAGK